ncbi:MAG TPA: MATE family efflux transporter, partial [Anaerolinea sp.]|nr:MATE family efflux transporter [Anaerolinea sp.]
MLKRLLPFINDKEYMAGLSAIAVPIILQQAIAAGLNAVDVFMLGQLGEVPVAAVGLANQITFLMM